MILVDTSIWIDHLRAGDTGLTPGARLWTRDKRLDCGPARSQLGRYPEFLRQPRSLPARGRLAGLGGDRYDFDVLCRLAIQRLWITAGNYAKAYRVAAGVDIGTLPWLELYGYRSVLAHMLPAEINDDRVWLETVEGVERFRAELPPISEAGDR